MLKPIAALCSTAAASVAAYYLATKSPQNIKSPTDFVLNKISDINIKSALNKDAYFPQTGPDALWRGPFVKTQHEIEQAMGELQAKHGYLSTLVIHTDCPPTPFCNGSLASGNIAPNIDTPSSCQSVDVRTEGLKNLLGEGVQIYSLYSYGQGYQSREGVKQTRVLAALECYKNNVEQSSNLHDLELKEQLDPELSGATFWSCSKSEPTQCALGFIKATQVNTENNKWQLGLLNTENAKDGKAKETLNKHREFLKLHNINLPNFNDAKQK